MAFGCFFPLILIILDIVTWTNARGVKPNFDNTPYSFIYGWMNQKTEIRCVADADPYPVIKWRHKDRDISAVDTYQITEETGTRQLTSILTFDINIFNKNTVFGTYTCIATNMYGKAIHDITLQEGVQPNAPILSIEEVTPTEINLVIISPAENAGLHVIDYKIIYYEFRSDNTIWSKAYISRDPGEARTQFLIGNLKAKTIYRINVAARNEAGYGAEASITLETPSVLVPDVPKITSSALSDTATAYTLSWNTPNNGGSELTAYNIKYTQVEVKEMEGVQEVAKMIGDTTTIRLKAESNSYQLQGLNSDAHYAVHLTAINAIGESMQETLIFRTARGGSDSVNSGSISMPARLPVYCLLSVLPALMACVLAAAW